MCSGRCGTTSVTLDGAIRCCTRAGSRSRTRVRRVMRPTQWRRSTHVVIGVAVLLLVAAVVAVAAVLTTGGSHQRRRRPSSRRRPRRPPSPAIVPVADSATKPTPDRLAADAGAAAGRPEPGRADRPDHRRDHRRAAVGAGRRRADAAGVDEQGAHRRRGAAGPRPRRPAHHPGDGTDRTARRRGAQGRRRPDAVGGARRAGHLVPGRGADQRPRRPGAPQRHRRRRRCRSTSAPTADRRWRRAGIRPTSTAATSRRWRR